MKRRRPTAPPPSCPPSGHLRLPFLHRSQFNQLLRATSTQSNLNKFQLDAAEIMKSGFLLFIDEAGDEGIERVRPIDPDGAPEYFVVCGIIIRIDRYKELTKCLREIKIRIGLNEDKELHFRDLTPENQHLVIEGISKFKHGIIAIVSNKRNMKGYRNRRIEQKTFEIDGRGKIRPQKNNWFYNNMLRYIFERASAECEKWTYDVYGGRRGVRVVLSYRRGFSYSQTRAYLEKLRMERHDRNYFNNKGSINWSVFEPRAIESRRAKNEPGLQFADCIASAIHRSIDEDWYGTSEPEHVELLASRFLHRDKTPRDYGFKLLPDGFRGPASHRQRRTLKTVGYYL